MPWKPTRPRTIADVARLLVRREVALGTIEEADAAAWLRHLSADFAGACKALGARQAAVAAAAPRRLDGEALIVSAIEAGKFSATRADFWRQRLADDFAGTARLIASLAALPFVTSGPAPSRAAEEAVHRAAFSSAFRREAGALGYVRPPRPSRILDRS